MFAASPSPTLEAAFGCLNKGGRGAFGAAPTFVASSVGDGEAANIAKTYAYTYQRRLYFEISFYIAQETNVGTNGALMVH